MGGAVGGLVDVVTSPASLVGSALGQVPVVGNVLGPAAQIAMGGNPFTAIGGQIAGNMLGGGGGSSSGSSTPTYVQPNIAYGNNTYTYDKAPVDTSQYFITGDKGVYNLLPALGRINAAQNQNIGFGQVMGMNRKNQYTPYEAYQDISAQMANDPTALAAFQKQFSLTPYTLNTNNPKRQSILAANPLSQQYVNFGLSNPIANDSAANYGLFANYAQQQNNPFFVPYESSGLTTSYFTPSAAALLGPARRESSPILSADKSGTTGNQSKSYTNTSKG